jgi:thymidylate kinase
MLEYGAVKRPDRHTARKAIRGTKPRSHIPLACGAERLACIGQPGRADRDATASTKESEKMTQPSPGQGLASSPPIINGLFLSLPDSKIASRYWDALQAAASKQGYEFECRSLSPEIISTVIPSTLTEGAECWLVLFRPAHRQESLIVTYPEPAVIRDLDSVEKVERHVVEVLKSIRGVADESWDARRGYENLDRLIRAPAPTRGPHIQLLRFQVLHSDRPIDELPTRIRGELDTTLSLITTAAPWITVTGLDGSGKSDLVRRLARRFGARSFRLPYHEFVKEGLRRSGDGTPFGDVYTDRLIMAADARLTNYRIRDWRRRHRLLVSQRAWMDNFVFGAVQGWSYAETDALLRTAELERPSAAIFLVAEPDIAFKRICTDPDADKFETPEFIRVQYRETLGFYRALEQSHPDLAAFSDVPVHLIDTSRLSEDAVFRAAESFLQQRLLYGITAEA